MRNLFKKIGMAMGAFALTLGIGLNAKAAAIDTGFDATSTQTMLTDLFANVSPTLKLGIVAVLGISLGIWVIFFLVGKLKKTTR